MFKRKMRLKVVVFLVLFLFGSYFSVVQWVLPNLIVKVHPVLFSLLKSAPKDIVFVDARFKNEYFTFGSFDNLKLKGHVVFSHKKSEKTIILIHGIRSRKENYFQMASKLAEDGFNVITFDLRGHGESEGEYCTFGVKEKEDVKALVQFASKKFDLNQFILWGQSLGGAIVLQSMNIDPRIIAGISESTFSDFESIAVDYIQNTLPLFPEFICNYSVNLGADKAGFNPKDASPVKACKSIFKPMLFVHGDPDEKINIDYQKLNYTACPSNSKELIIIKGAGHNNVWGAGGEVYFEKISRFIIAHFKY